MNCEDNMLQVKEANHRRTCAIDEATRTVKLPGAESKMGVAGGLGRRKSSFKGHEISGMQDKSA